MCDQNLGRLARWLRMMGFDTQYMRTWNEREIAEARAEGRILLTRRRDFAAEGGSIVLESDFVKEQLRYLEECLNLKEFLRPYSRCSVCNVELEYVKALDVKNLVPEYVSTTRETFARCPKCLRIYWKGTHTERSDEAMRRIFSIGAGA